MPALSAGMEEGTIVRWTKAVGDPIAKGDVIAEVETDKATMEYESEDDGVLGAIVAGDGATVAVNATIAILLLNGEDASAIAGTVPAAAPRTKPGPTAEPEVVSRRNGAEAGPGHPPRIAASPLARRIARDRGISIAGLPGSGARGRIVRIDVENAAQGAGVTPPLPPPTPPPAQQRPDAPYREIPHSNVRKVIARRLTEAKTTIPHFYLEAECEIDALLDVRAALNASGADAYKLSINDFIVKAAALALRKVPEANAAWTEDAILLFDDVDISVAVATEGGLITPIVRQADRKGLVALSEEVRGLAERAREGKLQPADYQGGGFTISNLGMYGVHAFSAIINPPQSCILAVGAAERRPVVRGDACVPATVLHCTLSVDHRSVDGAVGARYLAAFKALMEQPLHLML
jgi:pyruvate dehydrogenase E2 component (dihydrolipoamide acetyltransferase)